MSEAVSYELDGGVAVITIDDGKANAISHEVIKGLHEALSEADGTATAVLLVGRPGRFSAGFDLSVMTSGTDPMRNLVRAGAGLLLRLFMYPMPVVAACTGHALAAGALVLLASDERIGAEGEFKVGLNEVAIGMGLPHFAIELARYRMPPSQLDTALLGDVFPPAAAVTAGYLDRVVPAADLLDVAKETAMRRSALRTGAVRHSKELARGPIADLIAARLDADMESLSGPS
jgi:enoyl-CoA hydratase